MKMLDNLPWHALNTEHARLAMSSPRARKYPADVAPFAGTADGSAETLGQLLSLLEPEETTYLMGERPMNVPGLIVGESFPILQMTLAAGGPEQRLSQPEPNGSPVRLSAKDGDAMVELTTLAFPGFFRARTYEMGVYYGIHTDGELVAMAGERMAVPGYREISGVCTHPDHTGKGYAATLIMHLMREHVQTGQQSFLHVSSGNDRAIALYKRLGFSIRRGIWLHPLSRGAGQSRDLI